MGRPPSENPKNIELKARIDEVTNEKLINYCKKYQVSRTEVVREGVERILEQDRPLKGTK